jgi:hypothetical protein
MRIVSAVLLITAALSVASPAFAQATGTSSSKRPAAAKPPAPPLPKPVMNIRAFGAFDAEWMTASQSFEAITGSALMIGYGGGGEVVNLWKRLFVRGDYVTASSSGERGFDLEGGAVSIGVPITVRLNTIEIGGGWRFAMRKHPKYTPYGGAALLYTTYSQKSDFELPGDAVDDSNSGYAVFAGLDAQIAKRLYATFEAQYRLVPDAIGNAGVSKPYGETDLGGFVARVMVGYNLLKKK